MLKTVLNGVTLKNPVIAASGTFGFGQEYDQFFDISRLGGISSKGLTLEERFGNEGERVYETPSGLINSIGLGWTRLSGRIFPFCARKIRR